MTSWGDGSRADGGIKEKEWRAALEESNLWGKEKKQVVERLLLGIQHERLTISECEWRWCWRQPARLRRSRWTRWAGPGRGAARQRTAQGDMRAAEHTGSRLQTQSHTLTPSCNRRKITHCYPKVSVHKVTNQWPIIFCLTCGNKTFEVHQAFLMGKKIILKIKKQQQCKSAQCSIQQ